MSGAGAGPGGRAPVAGAQVVDAGPGWEARPSLRARRRGSRTMEDPQPLPQPELPLCDSLIIWVSVIRARRRDPPRGGRSEGTCACHVHLFRSLSETGLSTQPQRPMAHRWLGDAGHLGSQLAVPLGPHSTHGVDTAAERCGRSFSFFCASPFLLNTFSFLK